MVIRAVFVSIKLITYATATFYGPQVILRTKLLYFLLLYIKKNVKIF